MKRWLTDLLEAIARIAAALEALLDAVHALHTPAPDMGYLDRRVAELELGFEKRLAESEGLLLKAQGKFDAARAAEERARRLAQSNDEGEEDSFETAARAYAEASVPLGNGDGGTPEGVQPLLAGVEGREDRKSAAYAMKWGR